MTDDVTNITDLTENLYKNEVKSINIWKSIDFRFKNGAWLVHDIDLYMSKYRKYLILGSCKVEGRVFIKNLVSIQLKLRLNY